MVERNISKQVLTIGCDYKTTKGGISTVIASYSHIFSPFNFIGSTQVKSKIENLLYFIYSIISFTCKCIFCRKIRIIHIHTGSNNSFWRKSVYIKIAKRFNKKVVLHIHGGMFHIFYEKNKEKVDKILGKVDVIIALSQYWLKFFKETVGHKNVIIVPNITEYPKPDASLKKNDDITRVLFLGTINEAKGVFDMLEMVRENKEYLTNKLIIYIGGNGEVERFNNMIKEYGISNIVRFEGWVNEEKKAALLSECDIYLLPSYTEGLPISILEAMTYKLPIISTPVGGIPEIIENGKNGFLITPGNREELFNAINNLIKDSKKREIMGEEGYKKVSPHLPDNVSNVLTNIYNSL